MTTLSKINNFSEFQKLFKKRVFSSSSNPELQKSVSDIIDSVQKEGDEALLQYNKKFDNCTIESLAFSKSEIKSSYKNVTADLLDSMQTIHNRIISHHLKQIPQDHIYKDVLGNKLGWKWYPLESVGLYIPGGLATYPSSVLMTATIAKVAGVKNIIACSPTPNDKYNPATLAALDICGVQKVYRIGGAQAVAAMTYGTSTIPSVCKIFGPGNSYVSEAKRQLYGQVGIDMIAGPSEILIIADKNNNPSWVAADLLSQAEHDEMAQAILICDDQEFASKVREEIITLTIKNPRKSIIRKSLVNYGHILVVDDLKDLGIKIANYIAPEHIEILTNKPDEFIPLIRTAGAIFLGKYSPEAIGDYAAGPSHVLPTAGAARFSSGLSVFDFMRKSSVIQCSKESVSTIFNDASLMAESEGLAAHKLSLDLRKDGE